MDQKTNKQLFDEACKKAKARSLTFDYKGCVVHVNAAVQLVDGEPRIVAYSVTDWYAGDSTVRTYVDGEIRQ